MVYSLVKEADLANFQRNGLCRGAGGWVLWWMVYSQTRTEV